MRTVTITLVMLLLPLGASAEPPAPTPPAAQPATQVPASLPAAGRDSRLAQVKLAVGMKRLEAERLIAQATGVKSKYDLYAMDTSSEVRYSDGTVILIVRYKPGSPAPTIQLPDGSRQGYPPMDGDVLSWEFAAAGTPATQPARMKELIEALAGGHGDAAAHKAVRELRLLGKVALPYLTEAVKDNRRNVRWLAVEVLGAIGGLETAPVLIGAMGDPDKDVRRYAATFLGQVGAGDAPCLAALRKGLQDEDAEVLLHVLWSLDRLGDKAFRQDEALLERLLAQLTQGQTAWAAQCLGIVRNEKAVEPLVQAMRAKPEAAQGIGEALAAIRSRKAVPGLVAILKENGIDSRSVWQAGVTLQKLADPSANEELLAMTGSSSPWASLAAVEALGFAGNKGVVTRLSELATDGKLDKPRREGAVRALGRTEEASAVAALGAAVVDPEERVANEAAKALGWVKSREAAAVLRSRLNAESCGHVMYAVTSLGRIGDLSDAGEILKLFDRKDALDSTHFSNPRMANVATACHFALADITKTQVTDKDKLFFVISTPQQRQEIREAWRQKLAQLNAASRPAAPRAMSAPATGANAVPLSKLREVDLGDFWQGEKPGFREGSGIVSLFKKQAGYVDAVDLAVNNPAKSGRHAGAALFKSKQEAVAAVEFWRKNVANVIEPGTQTDQRRFPWWFCAKSSQPLLIVVHDGMVVWAGDITWGTPYNKVEGDLWQAVNRIHSSLLAERIQAEIQHATQPSKLAAERGAKLKAEVKTFMFGLDYWGEQDKPYSSLCLSVRRVLMANPYVQITEAQAAKIIDYLAAEGFLDKANDSKERPPGQGRHYRLWVRVGDMEYVQYEEWLGWDMKMLQRLDGLRTVLEGDAAKEMDRLLGRLSGHREEWKKQAATQPNTTSTQRQGE